MPPYSPYLNSIEQSFAKVKYWMRAPRKRTVEETWRHIGSLVSSIEPAECGKFFQSMLDTVPSKPERH